MTKTNVNITLDVNIIELVRLRQKVDDEFVLSNVVENFLREYFKEELNDPNLDKKKLDIEEFEIKKRMAIIKAKKEAIDRITIEKNNEIKDYWKQYPGMRRKDAVVIPLDLKEQGS